MESPQEFLMKYGICSDTTMGIEGDKKLTELLEEYANLALRVHDVVGRSEQLIAFSKWKEEKGYNPIYDHKGLVEEYLKSN